MNRQPHVIIVSHPRSGTHLTIDAISNNFPGWDRPYLNLDRLRMTHRDPLRLDEVSRSLAKAPHIIKTHAHSDVTSFLLGDQEHVRFVSELFETSRLLYVHRDGRDVMVSLYYYVQGYRPEMRDLTFSDFLRTWNDQDAETYDGDLSRPSYWARHVEGWLCNQRVATISFELLRTNFEQGIVRVAEALDQEAPEAIQEVVRTGEIDIRSRTGVWKDRIQRLGSRVIGGRRSTAVSFRKGETGDHESHFTDADREYFTKEAGAAMQLLGYE